MLLVFLWKRELVFQWEQKGHKNEDFRGCVWEQRWLSPSCLGMGWRWCHPQEPPQLPGAALSSARDGASGALEPQQTQLLLKCP